jgi:hypothetical protein
MKTALIFATVAALSFSVSGPTLASNCENDVSILEAEMIGLNLHVEDMKEVIAQIEAANGTGDSRRIKRLQEESAEKARKVTEIATEVLYVLESIGKDPANCGLRQAGLEDLHAYMTRISSVAKTIIRDSD